MREGQLKMCPALFKVNYVTAVVGKRVKGVGAGDEGRKQVKHLESWTTCVEFVRLI